MRFNMHMSVRRSQEVYGGQLAGLDGNTQEESKSTLLAFYMMKHRARRKHGFYWRLVSLMDRMKGLKRLLYNTLKN